MELTKEMIEKAKAAKTAKELVGIAKAEGVELTAEKAEKVFADLHKSGELADDELDNVSGGIRCDSTPSDGGEVAREKDVVHIYKIGQQVEVYYIGNSTERASRRRRSSQGPPGVCSVGAWLTALLKWTFP